MVLFLIFLDIIVYRFLNLSFMKKYKKLFKFLSVILIISSFFITGKAFSSKENNEISIVVQGNGTDSKTAKLDAFRNAIAQAVGTHIRSDTIVENYVTQIDKVKSKIEGFIKSSILINEKNQNGEVIATYNIVVSTKPLKEDVKNVVGVEFENVGHPTISVIQNKDLSKRSDQELTTTAISILNSQLIKRGYKVIDFNQIETLRNDDKELSKSNNFEQDIANKLKSDIYATVFGSTDAIKTSLSVKIYNSYTGQILGDETGYSSVKSYSLADMKLSVENSVNQSMEKILPIVSNHWQNIITNGQEYVIVFEKLNNDQRKKIKSLLKKSDFEDVEVISYKQNISVSGHAEFSVYVSGSPDDFFDELENKLKEENILLSEDPKFRSGRGIFIIKNSVE